MNPLLSIIVPTKNRYEYIREILAVLCKIKSEEIEFVIQDNSEENTLHDSFLDYIADYNDVRIKYFYHNGHLSINENSDRAVLNSTGKYVCFIGDDDCVTSHIVEATKWMEEESIDVLTFCCPTYIWPDVEYKYLSKKHTGVLSYKQPKGKVEIKNPLQELNSLLRKGGQRLSEMPQLYHGIVSRLVLNKIFDVTGSFFPGSVPDMDVAVGLSLYSTKYIKIDAPIILSGTAKKSAGGLGAAKMHKGDIRKISTLPKDTADFWNPNNPFFWSGPTIYADSIYKCLIRTGNERMLDNFNYNYLYAMLLIFENEYFKETVKTIKKNNDASIFWILYYSFLLFIIRAKYFILNRIPYNPYSKVMKVNFSDISKAVIFLENVIDVMDLPWKKSKPV